MRRAASGAAPAALGRCLARLSGRGWDAASLAASMAGSPAKVCEAGGFQLPGKVGADARSASAVVAARLTPM